MLGRNLKVESVKLDYKITVINTSLINFAQTKFCFVLLTKTKNIAKRKVFVCKLVIITSSSIKVIMDYSHVIMDYY